MICNLSCVPKTISAKLTDEEIELAKAYIHGAVYAHCNCCPNQYFSVRILFGGANRDWGGTPLQKIYDHHLSVKKSPDPANAAAKDVGCLLKDVLASDHRAFERVGKTTGNEYILVT